MRGERELFDELLRHGVADLFFLRREVPFVDDEDKPLAAFENLADEPLVLLGEQVLRVEQHERDVATVYRLVGAHVGVVFERGVHTAFAAQPRGVEEAEFFAAELDHGVDYVARRAGYVADHRALLSGECVEQARLAYVRAADERHADFVGILVEFVVLELRGDDVHQLVEAGVVLGADADDFVEAEAVGLAYHRVFEVLAVELVHRYDYRLAAPAQLVRYLRVGRRHAGLSVDDEDYHSAFVDGEVNLLFD